MPDFVGASIGAVVVCILSDTSYDTLDNYDDLYRHKCFQENIRGLLDNVF